MFEYLRDIIFLNKGNVFQTLIVASVLVFAIEDFKFTKKGVIKLFCRFIANAFIMFASSAAWFALLYSVLSVADKSNFAVNFYFYFATVTDFVIYTAFFNKYDVKIKTLMSAYIFSSIGLIIESSGVLFYLLCIRGSFAELQATVIRSSLWGLVLLFVFVFKKYPLNKFDGISTRIFVFLFIMNAVTDAVYLCSIIASVSGLVPSWFNIAVMAALYVILVIGYMVAYYGLYEEGEKLTLLAEKQMEKFTRNSVELLERKTDDMREIRHELKNQYAALGIMLEQGRYDELKEFFGEMSDKAIRSNTYIDCGNKQINAAVNMEAEKAKMLGIEVKYNLLLPSVLPFKTSDLYSIICNLMDNAIEAIDREKLSNGYIGVTVAVQKSSLYISVENSLPEGMNEKKTLSLKSAKGDKVQHGYGSKIVNRIAESYGGYASRRIENNMFIAEVLLSFPEISGKKSVMEVK